MRRRWKQTRPDGLISASEIACYAYCPEQWRFEYGLGLTAANKAARDAGTRHHAAKAMAEQIAGGLIILGRILLFLAIVGLLAALVIFR